MSDVQQADDMEKRIADLRRAMEEAMHHMRTTGMTDFAYQRLSVALDRDDTAALAHASEV